MLPEATDQTAGQPVPQPLRRREGAGLPLAAGARPDHEIGAPVQGREQTRQLRHVDGAIAVHEGDERGTPEGLHRTPAGGSIAGCRLVDDPRPGRPGPGRGGVARPVVADHQIVHQTLAGRVAQREQRAHHLADARGLVQRGYDDGDAMRTEHRRSLAQGTHAG